MSVNLKKSDQTSQFSPIIDRMRQLQRFQFEPRTVEKIELIINSATRAQFESQGRRGGTPWRPLAGSTVRQRIRQGFGAGPILLRTGRLAAALSSGQAILSPSGSQIEMRYDQIQAEIGARHQRGTKRMPSRPVNVLTPSDQRAISDVVAEQILNTLLGK